MPVRWIANKKEKKNDIWYIGLNRPFWNLWRKYNSLTHWADTIYLILISCRIVGLLADVNALRISAKPLTDNCICFVFTSTRCHSSSLVILIFGLLENLILEKNKKKNKLGWQNVPPFVISVLSPLHCHCKGDNWIIDISQIVYQDRWKDRHYKNTV